MLNAVTPANEQGGLCERLPRSHSGLQDGLSITNAPMAHGNSGPP
eukprot:COSAG04_NODE_28554_length_275_cov_0.573864_1_plen_44_part_10